MTTGFRVANVDISGTFEPYTLPYTQTGNTFYTVDNIDLRTQFLGFSALGNWYVNTSGGTQFSVATERSATYYEHTLKDLNTIFPTLGSVSYGIVIPVSGQILNLDTASFVKNYLQANFPAFYDSTYSYFNANTNTGAGFSGSKPSIILWVQSNGFVYSNSTALPALNCSAFPNGVYFKLINEGAVVGALGPYGTTNGQNGGTAISLSANMQIDNTSGNIWAGGGSGGSGGPAVCQGTSADTGPYSYVIQGGKAGNGAGGNNGVYNPAQNGSIGGLLGRIKPCNVNNVTGYYAEWGGNGGTYGALGELGYNTVTPYQTTNYESGGAAGNGGVAVQTNGYSLTWLGGGTSPNVMGSIV